MLTLLRATSFVRTVRDAQGMVEGTSFGQEPLPKVGEVAQCKATSRTATGWFVQLRKVEEFMESGSCEGSQH